MIESRDYEWNKFRPQRVVGENGESKKKRLRTEFAHFLKQKCLLNTQKTALKARIDAFEQSKHIYIAKRRSGEAAKRRSGEAAKL
jgi:cell fate (sporulation/competence/biofilm development) regulator YlbF (YheA/YmcA/DUF963 family)